MKPNLPILTGIRFFAAFYVFIFQIDSRIPLDFLGKPIIDVISQGATGVNVFFILSGFILYYNYHDKQINFTEFILKRIAKIYPVYLAGFFLCFAVVFLNKIRVDSFFEVMMMNLLMVQSYLPKFSLQWYGSGSWSISTEFFFYLCFPILLLFISKLSKISICLLFVTCFALSVLPGALYNLKLIDFLSTYSFPPSRVWEFIIGMLTASMVIKHRLSINNFVIFFILIFSALYFYFFGRKLDGYVVQNIIVVPLMVAILISATTQKKQFLSFLGNKFFEYLGKVSYSFYIVQIPIMIYLDHNNNYKLYNPALLLVSLFLINLLIAVIMYHIIESPFHQYLNKKIKENLFARKNGVVI